MVHRVTDSEEKKMELNSSGEINLVRVRIDFAIYWIRNVKHAHFKLKNE
jgi:hypothetical protein